MERKIDESIPLEKQIRGFKSQLDGVISALIQDGGALMQELHPMEARKLAAKFVNNEEPETKTIKVSLEMLSYLAGSHLIGINFERFGFFDKYEAKRFELEIIQMLHSGNEQAILKIAGPYFVDEIKENEPQTWIQGLRAKFKKKVKKNL